MSSTRQTGARADDEALIGAEIAFGKTLLGYGQAVIRDPISQRVRRLITTYGPTGRRVAVPIEWITKRTPSRVELGVGASSLDDLPERIDVVSQTKKEDPTV